MEIDYQRWKEFLRSKGITHVPDKMTAERLKLEQDYVRWLKQQQKPAHLDFEVK